MQINITIATPPILRVIIAMMKHNEQTSCGRKGLYGLHFQSSVYHWRNQGRNTIRQELTQKPCMCVCWGIVCTDLLASHGLLSLRSYRTQDHTIPGLHLLHWAVSFPHQSSIMKMPYRLASSLTDGSVFSVEVSSSLMTLACQVVRKPASKLLDYMGYCYCSWSPTRTMAEEI